jgi:cytoskeletal protein RodZ
MKKKSPWSRADKLTGAGVVVAVVAIAVGLLIPEVRRAVGLEKPAPVPATATLNATPQASPTTPTKDEESHSESNQSIPANAQNTTAKRPDTKRNTVMFGNGGSTKIVGNYSEGGISAHGNTRNSEIRRNEIGGTDCRS